MFGYCVAGIDPIRIDIDRRGEIYASSAFVFGDFLAMEQRKQVGNARRQAAQNVALRRANGGLSPTVRVRLECLATHFALADFDGVGLLDFAQYQNFVRSFKERKDVQNLYRNINFGTDLDMTLEAFLGFMRDDQGADIEKDRAWWESVFYKFAKPAQNRAALPDARPVQ